jgi:glucose/mannose transport system substrate-binding protein
LETRTKIALYIIIAVVVTGGVVGGVTYVVLAPSAEQQSNTLYIYNWWTSGGEAAAIDALVGVFSAQYPQTTAVQVQIAGGSGIQLRTKIKTLMLAGDPPDTFQIHAGYEWKTFYDANLLDNIDFLWTPALQAVIPDVVESINKGPDDHYYSVPVDIHRSNVLWFDYHVLNNTGIGIDPSTLTSYDALIQACQWIVGNGTNGITKPISIGPAWTQAHLLEQILASNISAYEAWINGEIDSTSAPYYPALLQACETYVALKPYIASPSGTWDAATAKLIAHTAAFNIMGDWANGEFLQANFNFTDDYGTVAAPGTGNMYGLVIDCFEKPKGIAHPTNVDNWLGVVASKAGQDAFNPLKGSIAARTDADPSKYGAYQAMFAIPDFAAISASGYMYPSVVHGSGAPEGFNTDYQPLVGQLQAGTTTAAQCATAIAALAVTYHAEFTRVWDLTP